MITWVPEIYIPSFSAERMLKLLDFITVVPTVEDGENRAYKYNISYIIIL